MLLGQLRVLRADVVAVLVREAPGHQGEVAAVLVPVLGIEHPRRQLLEPFGGEIGILASDNKLPKVLSYPPVFFGDVVKEPPDCLEQGLDVVPLDARDQAEADGGEAVDELGDLAPPLAIVGQHLGGDVHHGQPHGPQRRLVRRHGDDWGGPGETTKQHIANKLD